MLSGFVRAAIRETADVQHATRFICPAELLGARLSSQPAAPGHYSVFANLLILIPRVIMNKQLRCTDTLQDYKTNPIPLDAGSY